MTWKTVRLELAATEAFPRGSPARAFLLNVPITRDGLIDPVAITKNPALATVRRYWGSEPDSFGLIEAAEDSWALRCGKGAGERSTFILDSVPLFPDGEVIVGQPGGTRLPFRVASVRPTGHPN